MSDSPRRMCSQCMMLLPFEAFPRHARGRDGLSAACKACEKERLSVRKHGVTSLEKEQIAEAQDGCATCGRLAPGGRGWAVDHDHSCCVGDVSCPSCRRGVLCHWCNAALGYAGDNPTVLRRMADYLELGTRLDVDSDPEIRSGHPIRSRTDIDGQGPTDGAGQDARASGSFAARARAPRKDSTRGSS